MFRLEIIAALCLTCAVFTSSQVFPADIERCKYSDDACLSKVATSVLQLHSTGHTGLNLIRTNPLHAASLVLPKIPGGPVSVEFKFKNLDLVGFHEATVTKLTGFTKDLSDFVLEMQLSFPKFVMSGEYSCDGSILSLPINGQGNSRITFVNTIVTAKAKCNTRQENGKPYISIVDVELDINPENVIFAFDNIVKGITLLSDNMNRLINNNWKVVYGVLKPLFEKGFAEIGKNVVNGVFSTIPSTELFLSAE